MRRWALMALMASGVGLAIGMLGTPAAAAPEPSPSIALDSWVVWVDVSDGVLALEYDVIVVNSGTTSYTGTQKTAQGKPAVLSLPLPPDARSFQYLGFLSDTAGVRGGGAFVHTQALPPGQSQGAIRFEVDSVSQLNLPVPLATTSLTVLVPDGMTVSSPRLVAGDTTRDRGTTYRMFVASDVKAGEVVTASVSGTVRAAKKWDPATIGALVLLGAITVGALVYYWRRRQPGLVGSDTTGPLSASASSASGGRPRTVAAAVAAATDAETRRDRHWQEELLLDSVALLDLAHEKGVITNEREYRERRAAMVTRLGMLRRTEAGVVR